MAYLSIIMQNNIKKAQIVVPVNLWMSHAPSAIMDFIKIKKVKIMHAHFDTKCRGVKSNVFHQILSLICLHSFLSLRIPTKLASQGESLGIPIFLFFSDLRFLIWQIQKSMDSQLKIDIDYHWLSIDDNRLFDFNR